MDASSLAEAYLGDAGNVSTGVHRCAMAWRTRGGARVLLMTMVLLFPHSHLRGADHPKALADHCLQGFLSNIERAGRGSVAIEYRVRMGGVVDEWRGNLRFDHPKQHCRIDRVRVDVEDPQRERIVTHVRNEFESLLYVHGTGVVAKYEREAQSTVPDAEPLELGMLGIAALGELYTAKRVEALVQVLSEKAVASVSRQGDAIEIVWEYSVQVPGGGRVRRTTVFDAGKGYAPVLMKREAVEGASHLQKAAQATTVTDWTRLADTWVPERVSLSEQNGTSEGLIQLRWDAVNEPLDDLLFSAEGIGAPSGTLVSNYRVDPPITEYVLGEEASATPPRRVAGTWQWTITVLTLLGGAAVIWAAYAILRFLPRGRRGE